MDWGGDERTGQIEGVEILGVVVSMSLDDLCSVLG